MARVNRTLPDDLLSQARAGLQVLRLALAALAEELDRRTERSRLADDNCARTRLREVRNDRHPVRRRAELDSMRRRVGGGRPDSLPMSSFRR